MSEIEAVGEENDVHLGAPLTSDVRGRGQGEPKVIGSTAQGCRGPGITTPSQPSYCSTQHLGSSLGGHQMSSSPNSWGVTGTGVVNMSRALGPITESPKCFCLTSASLITWRFP